MLNLRLYARSLALLLLLLQGGAVMAQDQDSVMAQDQDSVMVQKQDSVVAQQQDSLMAQKQDSVMVQKQDENIFGEVKQVVRGFSRIDTNYIEPQHYEFTVMAQITNTYDIYTIGNKEGHHVTFSPDIRTKVGPYIGWRWFFLGYTFDLKSLGFGSNDGRKKTEIDFSIYSSQIGADIYYRRTGSDYKIRDINMGDGVDVRRLNGMDFDGINVSITGFNLYYIFNSKRFSYPAAFAQSTCQKRSQGSWMAGIGWMKNSIDFDHQKLNTMIKENTVSSVQLDSGLMFNNLKHTDFHVSAGYGYNWVFAPNWLFASSLSLALAYKTSSGDAVKEWVNDFDLEKINLDGIARFGIVYNNTRWYAGASAILRTYTYENDYLETRNHFGSFNFYLGYNFGLKKKYKRAK